MVVPPMIAGLILLSLVFGLEEEPEDVAPLERSDCYAELKTSTTQAHGQDSTVGHMEMPPSFRIWIFSGYGDLLSPKNTWVWLDDIPERAEETMGLLQRRGMMLSINERPCFDLQSWRPQQPCTADIGWGDDSLCLSPSWSCWVPEPAYHPYSQWWLPPGHLSSPNTQGCLFVGKSVPGGHLLDGKRQPSL